MDLGRPPSRSANGHGANGGSQTTAYFNQKPLATPATRKLARDLGVDLRNVPPTGPHGRVTKDDVRQMQAGAGPTVSSAGSPSASSPMVVPSLPTPAARPASSDASVLSTLQTTLQAPSFPPVHITSSRTEGAEEDERIPLRGIRRRIFEGMSRSKHTAAHFTFVEECDVGRLKELRSRLRPAAEAAGVKLTYLPFIAKAVVAALKKHPTLNAAFDESTQEIVVRKRCHLGIASATEAGLIVPVVRDADRLSILDIAREIGRLGEAARDGKIRPDDLGGSTFTITSLGQQGGLFATPVLNFPEVAILGVHQMKQKPVVRNGEIVVGDVMLLSLSFDHRIIDGHIGAAFAYEVIGFLEDPDRLFLEMS
jgi:pyruvate dehydrogenase E2 component (dihydrolipoamide acetyltransferase)